MVTYRPFRGGGGEGSSGIVSSFLRGPLLPPAIALTSTRLTLFPLFARASWRTAARRRPRKNYRILHSRPPLICAPAVPTSSTVQDKTVRFKLRWQLLLITSRTSLLPSPFSSQLASNNAALDANCLLALLCGS